MNRINFIRMIMEWVKNFIQNMKEISNGEATPKPEPPKPEPPSNSSEICDEPFVQNRKGKILLWDTNESHAADVKNVFLGMYPEAASRITLHLGYNFEAIDPFDLVLKSTTGFERQLSLAQKHPEVCFVMPVGSNQDKEMTFYNNNLGEIVLTRGYEPDDKIGTAFGNVLEFWERDHKDDNKAVSSYSNARVAAKLLKIWEARGGCWEDTRAAARKTALRNKNTHPNNEAWNKKFGFGQIRVQEAIKW